jgi:hypothetical protein
VLVGSSTSSIGSASHARSCSPTRQVGVCKKASLTEPSRQSCCPSDLCFLILFVSSVRRGRQAGQEE